MVLLVALALAWRSDRLQSSAKIKQLRNEHALRSLTTELDEWSFAVIRLAKDCKESERSAEDVLKSQLVELVWAIWDAQGYMGDEKAVFEERLTEALKLLEFDSADVYFEAARGLLDIGPVPEVYDQESKAHRDFRTFIEKSLRAIKIKVT